MKKYIFFATVLISTFLWRCDYIKVPPYAGGSGIAPTTDTVRKVLVEDFTGHTCTNCPDAANMIDTLEQLYPDQIIPVAVHTTAFADPCPPAPLPGGAPLGSYTQDFRVTGEDAAYDAIYGSNSWPPPQGMINHYGYPLTVPTGVGAWSSTVAGILAQPMTAYLKITPTYNSTSRSLSVSVSGKIMTDTTGTFLISLYLVEDSIVGWQLVHGVNDSDYVFNHVFRGCINTPGSISGDTVLTGNIPNGTAINYTMTNSFTVSNAFNAAHCKVVAYIYKSSDYGVLQAAQAKLQ
ncbi:MAG: Omp28-related outer membrane protein [Bacteroidetes bacterium]|nr:Omp28-related outer membrane protein [Bacteroidota bacterium]